MVGNPALATAALDCFASLAMTRILILTVVLALAGCGEQRPPAPTPEQNDQLNEAEAMLNEEARVESRQSLEWVENGH